MIVENDIWGGILDSIKTKLSNETFETWFSLIAFRGVDYANSTIRLRAPNDVVRGWVTTNFTTLLGQSLGELGLPGYSVQWVVESDDQASLPKPTTTTVETLIKPADVVESTTPEKSETSTTPLFFSPSRSADTPGLDPSLNSKYSYEGFVVGSCNQFAHAASLAVAEAPGKTYNRYISMVELDRQTHLMHACGHAIKQRNPHLRLCYLSSESS